MPFKLSSDWYFFVIWRLKDVKFCKNHEFYHFLPRNFFFMQKMAKFVIFAKFYVFETSNDKEISVWGQFGWHFWIPLEISYQINSSKRSITSWVLSCHFISINIFFGGPLFHHDRKLLCILGIKKKSYNFRF